METVYSCMFVFFKIASFFLSVFNILLGFCSFLFVYLFYSKKCLENRQKMFKLVAMKQEFKAAKQVYAQYGVDVEKAIEILDKIPLSMHCWQGDDVGGFESPDAVLSGGGIQATGNFFGKARNPEQLRADILEARKYIPGKTRLNLHAIYGEFGGKKIDRNEISFEHFKTWVDWCKANGLGMDFNPSYFSHPLAADGMTLSSPDKSVRNFWIEHGIACRKIAEKAGKILGDAVITNFWMPDGMKDIPADRLAPRERMQDSLDKIFKEKINPKFNRDAVESKLFGIGSESYVVGSHEFFMGYAFKNKKILTLDTGHFHPTESIADKISSTLLFVPELLLHVSRGVRWDSDHVVIFDDSTAALMQEIIRCDALAKVHIGMDFFDASINRIFAWVIGMRSARKCLLSALLEPSKLLRSAENSCDFGSRLALMEEAKSLPLSAVWAEYCLRSGVSGGLQMLSSIKKYEATVLRSRK